MKLITFGLFSLLLSLAACKSAPLATSGPHQLFELKDSPLWGTSSSGVQVYAGGFSGLIYLGKNPKNGEYQFMTVTDRGPNEDPKEKHRIFLLPQYSPKLVKLETVKADKTFKIISETVLTDPAGEPLSGLGQIDKDEPAVDPSGKELAYHMLGMDSESLTVDKEGNFWIAEEYRPSLMKFSKRGKLLKRYVPKNSMPATAINRVNNKFAGKIIEDVLPEHLNERRHNRGFESITVREGLVYAMLESPMKKDGKSLLIEFSPKKSTVLREFDYPYLNSKREKLSDMTVLPNGNFAIIEQNARDHIVAEFSLPASGRELSPQEIINLGDEGFSFAEKIEGLTALTDGNEQYLAVVNDNDFGLFQASKKIGLGLFKINK